MNTVDPVPGTAGGLLNPGASKRALPFKEALSECVHNQYVVGGQPGRNAWIFTPIVSVEILQSFPRRESSHRSIQGSILKHQFVVVELEKGMCQNDLGRYIKIERFYSRGGPSTGTVMHGLPALDMMTFATSRRILLDANETGERRLPRRPPMQIHRIALDTDVAERATFCDVLTILGILSSSSDTGLYTQYLGNCWFYARAIVRHVILVSQLPELYMKRIDELKIHHEITRIWVKRLVSTWLAGTASQVTFQTVLSSPSFWLRLHALLPTWLVNASLAVGGGILGVLAIMAIVAGTTYMVVASAFDAAGGWTDLRRCEAELDAHVKAWRTWTQSIRSAQCAPQCCIFEQPLDTADERKADLPSKYRWLGDVCWMQKLYL